MTQVKLTKGHGKEARLSCLGRTLKGEKNIPCVNTMLLKAWSHEGTWLAS